MSPTARATLSLATIVFLAAPPIAAHAPTERVLTNRIPAAALTHLDLTALDGTVTLTADPSPTATDVVITVTVNAAPKRLGHKVPAVELADVTLDCQATANVLRVGLTHAAEGAVDAVWTVTVPARFSARVDAHDASVTIDGLAGGVDARVNSGLRGRRGALTVDVPRGRLTLSMGVGDIRATRRSAEFSSAVVSSTVGDAELYLIGHEIVAPHKPGPGHRLSLDGRGGDALAVTVSVGDVSLKIG
jgi:hypothetical protein